MGAADALETAKEFLEEVGLSVSSANLIKLEGGVWTLELDAKDEEGNKVAVTLKVDDETNEVVYFEKGAKREEK